MKPFLLSLVAFSVFISPTFSQTPKYSIGSGEYQNFILDNTTHTLYGLGTAGNGIGSNSGQFGLPIPCQFPNANTQIKFVAAGLHTGACVDMSGNVYFTGGNEDGSMGNGTTGGSSKSFVQVTTDSLGNAFGNVNYLTMGSAIFSGGQGYGACIMAVKNDGTLWVWGNTQGGYRGDGTYGQVNTRPVQVPFPAGTVITKVFIQNIALALDASGNVWTWGGNGPNNCLLGNNTRSDYMTPEKVNLPGPAKDIAGGGMWSYALLQSGSLYGWGLYEGYLGVGGAASSLWTNMSGPVLLDNELNLPAPISQISCNKTSSYAILTDGTLWAWGGNECGQIGNGQEINWAAYTVNPAPYGGTPTPYAWDWGMSPAEFQQHKPVQIAPGINNFVAMSEGEETVFYKFAVDANGQMYSWGRNKTGILANGVMDGDYQNGQIAANYPNSFDVPYITAINPFTPGAKTILSTSPECITNPGAAGCNIYPVPANTPPTSSAGPNQSVTGATANLDGSGSTDNVAIVYYVWSQVSGPSNALIVIPSGAKAQARNLVNGVYKFQLKVIDNGWMSDSSTVTITVNNTGGQLPAANAGSNQTITLPTNSVTLAGSGSEVGGSIASFKWTQLSGPSTASLGSGTLATTTAGNLVQGTYTFQLTVTDLLNISASATVTVTVNAAPVVAGPPSANAGSNQSITLPTNSVTLTGSGSETNGSIVSYAWSQTGGPSTAGIANAGAASTNVSGLAQGTYTFQLTVKDNSGKTASATVQVTVNAAAVVPGAPSASAGSNQTITLPTNSVTLTGSGSETNGSITSYAWTQTSGPSTAAVGAATQPNTTVSGLVQGTYTFKLTVTDNSGKTASATVQVIVNAAPVVPGAPVASAGSNQTITLPTNSVSLYGNGSETNGIIVSYQWTQTSGPSTVTLYSAAQASTFANGFVQGGYTFQLTVTDNSGKTASATVTVTVNGAPVVPGVPQVTAGANQTITLPTTSVSLYGNATETNGTIVSYQWSQVSGPSASTLYSAAQSSTYVNGLVQGTYTFQLTVTDNSGKTASATVQVTVNVATNLAPVAIAGANRTVTQSSSPVVLNGSASYDPDGTIVGYAWVQVAGAGGVTIANSATATPSIYGLQVGSYTFQLTVTDNKGSKGSVNVTITVVATSTQTLVADAGIADTVSLPIDTATLDGSGSTVSSGAIVSYTWKELNGPSTVVIGSSSSAVAQVSGLQAGGYTFQLTVTDNNGDTASAKVNVIVLNNSRRYTSGIRLWPNPVQSVLNVWYQSTNHDQFALSIYNTSGVNMMTTAYSNLNGQMNFQINVSQLARGVYFLVVKDSNGERLVRKFVKQ